MNARFIDWIWRIKGSLALAPGQSSDAAFERLAPLFSEAGTSHERTDDTLTFRKKNQLAQDKMSIFDGGVLRIENDGARSVLRYHLTSRALLFCFLAPLMFIGFGQLTVAMGKFQKPPIEKSKPEAKKTPMPLNPIDKALGAPAPEKPNAKDAEKEKERRKKPSPTAAYVFAGIFATLYLVGRILEAWLVKALFRKRLLS